MAKHEELKQLLDDPDLKAHLERELPQRVQQEDGIQSQAVDWGSLIGVVLELVRIWLERRGGAETQTMTQTEGRGGQQAQKP